jgi:hypothetical protein
VELAGKLCLALAKPCLSRLERGDLAAQELQLRVDRLASGPQAKRRPGGGCGPRGQRRDHQRADTVDGGVGAGQQVAVGAAQPQRAIGAGDRPALLPGANRWPSLQIRVPGGDQVQVQGVGDAVDLQVLGAALGGGVVAVGGLGLLLGGQGGGMHGAFVGGPHAQRAERGGHEGLGELGHRAASPVVPRGRRR